MMRKTLLLLAATVACAFSAQARKTYTLSSPEGRLQTTVAADDALTYAVTFDGRPVLDASPLSLTLDDGTTWGIGPRVAGVSRTSVDTVIPSPFYRADSLRERYNSLTTGPELRNRKIDDHAAESFGLSAALLRRMQRRGELSVFQYMR